jgi:U3 small nucleolar RNA-associated protein 5
MSSKKAPVKPPKGRPASTSALAQPAIQDAPAADVARAAFSDDGRYLAVLSLAVDKHRLRVHDAVSGKSIAENTVDTARITAFAWVRFDAALAQRPDAAARKAKKKRKSDGAAPAPSAPDASTPESVVALGLSDGTILLFSPAHARVLRTLTHPTSTAPIAALDATPDALGALALWSAGADGVLRVWDAQTGAHRASHRLDDRTPPTALRVRPGADGDADTVHVLLAHYRIRLVAAPHDLSAPKDVADFTGHASDVAALYWQPAPSRHFASIARGDRHVQLWDASQGAGTLVASLALDADARTLAYDAAHVLAVSASGRVAVFDGAPPKKKAKVAVAAPRCTIAPPIRGQAAPVVAAAFEGDGKVRVARLVGGVKPIVDIVVRVPPHRTFLCAILNTQFYIYSHSSTTRANTSPILRYPRSTRPHLRWRLRRRRPAARRHGASARPRASPCSPPLRQARATPRTS